MQDRCATREGLKRACRAAADRASLPQIFWDADTWMFPSLLAMWPDYAEVSPFGTFS